MPEFDNFLGTLQNNNRMKSGQENVIRCANCGAPNSLTAIVCANCGNAVNKQLSGGFTVNKNAFGRDSQPYGPAQQIRTVVQQPAHPAAPRPSQMGQPPRYAPVKPNAYYRNDYRENPDYYSYYNGGNGNGRATPVQPRRPEGPYPPPAAPYANGAAPQWSGAPQAYPASPYANNPPVRPAEPRPQPPYAQNGNGFTAPQARLQYEVLIPESGQNAAPQWTPPYTGQSGYAPAVGEQQYAQPYPAPQPIPQPQPAAPVSGAPQQAVQAQAVQPPIPPNPASAPDDAVLLPILAETQTEESLTAPAEAQKTISETGKGVSEIPETRGILEIMEEAWAEDEPRGESAGKRAPEPQENKEDPDEEFSSEGSGEDLESDETDRPDDPDAEENKPDEEDTDEDEAEDAYTRHLKQYKEQLRLTFDEGKEGEKNGAKKRNPYRDEFGAAPGSNRRTEQTEAGSDRPEEEPVLQWKNIPRQGKKAPERRTAPERPNLYKQDADPDDWTETADDSPAEAKPSSRSADGKPGPSNKLRGDGERDKSSQSVTEERRYHTEPESSDDDYHMSIQDAGSKPEKTTDISKNKGSLFGEGQALPKPPPMMKVETAESAADPMPQMWAAYQQQMMNAYSSAMGMGGQPVMIPPQMQAYAQMQGFPGTGGQPVAFQSAMMPAGIPVPMYVMMNPGGGMTMYYINPASVPPMLPQSGTTGESYEPMIAPPSEMMEKVRNHERYDGRYLAYMDFSADKYLRWEHIRFADNIVGVKYPAEFDIENADFTGKDISFSDFSNLPYLKWKQIKRAASLKGIIYSREFNVERADYSGRDISQSDFSALRTLRWKNIAEAGSIKGIVYPEEFDIDRADFTGRDISFSDFTRLEEMRWKHIRTAGSIRGIAYPAEFNIDRAEFFDRDISFSDFTRVLGLRWHHIANTYRIYGISYPDTFNVENTDFTGRNISYSDFSKLTRLEFSYLREAQKINGIVYPPTMNMQRTDYRGRDISYSDFSLVKNMRFLHIAEAADIKGMIYPPSFDLENADFRRFDMRDSDFSLLPAYKKPYLESFGGENITPPSTGSVIR